jgi:hypothetical protein
MTPDDNAMQMTPRQNMKQKKIDLDIDLAKAEKLISKSKIKSNETPR